MYVVNKELEYKDLGNGVKRKILAYSDNLMNTELLFEAGAKGEMHKHPHEQIGYVIEGRLIYHEEGCEDKELETGDAYYVAPNKLHGIECITAVKLMDIFTPKRSDFL